MCCLLLRERGSLVAALRVKEGLTPQKWDTVAQDGQQWGAALVRAAVQPFWDKSERAGQLLRVAFSHWKHL